MFLQKTFSRTATAAIIVLSSTAAIAADFRDVWKGHPYYTCDVRPVKASSKDPRWVYVGPDYVKQRNFYAQTVFARPNNVNGYVIFDPIIQRCALKSTHYTENQRPVSTAACDPAHINGNTMFHAVVGGFRGGNYYAINSQQYWSNYLADRNSGLLSFRNIAGLNSTLFYLQNCHDNNGRFVDHPPL
jgi:hypothetical protein